MLSTRVLLRTVLFVAGALPVMYASDFTGVYARIDRVVIENGTAKIWGVFAAANPNDRSGYLPPVRGYLYFKPGSNQQLALNEWNDLKEVAGKKEIVAFSSRPFTARIRKPDEKPEGPDIYTVNTGVNRVRASNTDYPPVRSLLDFKD